VPLPAAALTSDTTLYAVGAGLFLLVLVLVLVLVARSRRRREAPQQPSGVSWGEPMEPLPEPTGSLAPASFPEPQPDPLAAAPAPAQVHYCRCPACQTQFTVNGTKPIVTNCPGCGKKGYLR
jgi:hypothetical protein